MSDANYAPYTPYGAFELKATYQRNLLLGNLAVISLVLALLVTAWTFTRNDPIVVVPLPEKPEAKPMEWRQLPPRSIQRDLSAFPGAPAVVPEMARGIPVPMPDSAIADPDVMVMSQADRASLLAWEVGTGSGEPGTFVLNTGVGEVLPPIDSFFRVEIVPVLVHHIAPEYPRFAEQAGVEGTVWIKALVSKTGAVLKAVVYKSSEVPSLDDAALDVADQYRYKPAIQNSEPVAVWVTYRVDFILED